MKNLLERKMVFLAPSKILSADGESDRFDRYRLLLLSESIRENGVAVPVIVRRTREGYRAISGERRIKAALLAGVKKIPCVVISRGDGALVRAIENFTERETDPFAEAAELLRLSKHYPAEKLAAALSRSTLEIENYLSLLTLPETVRTRAQDMGLPACLLFAFLGKTETEQTKMLDLFEELPDSVKEEEQNTPAVLILPKRQTPPIRDSRFFVNSIRQLADRMNGGGVPVTVKQTETAHFTDIKIHIAKPPADSQISLLCDEPAAANS